MSFADILNKPVQSAEKPRPVPPGSYMLRIKGREIGESQQKKTPFVRFFYTIEAPGPDVNMAQLDGVDLTKKTLRDDFYLTDDALYRLREFLENALGLNCSNESFGQVLVKTDGLRVIGNVKQVASKREGSTDIFNEIVQYARAA